MLQNSSDNVRLCFRRANECHERALSTENPVLKDSMLSAEQGWMRLANSYELTERLSCFIAEARRGLGK